MSAEGSTEQEKTELMVGVDTSKMENDDKEEEEEEEKAAAEASAEPPPFSDKSENAMDTSDSAKKESDREKSPEKDSAAKSDKNVNDEATTEGDSDKKVEESGKVAEGDGRKSSEIKDTGDDKAKSDTESHDDSVTNPDGGSTAGPDGGSATLPDSRSVTPDSRCMSPAAGSDISNQSSSLPPDRETTPTLKKPRQKKAGDNDSLVSAEDSEDLRLMQDPIDREVEATDDYEMVDEVNERHSYATRKKSPKWKYKQPGTKFTGETPSDWLLPFQEGWMREIVIRNVSDDSSGRKPADVYYYSPTKKKLRSAPEITKYLQSQGAKNKLDISCFTFTKQQIYKEPAEFVRHAGIAGKGRGGSKNLVHSDTPLKFRSPISSSPVGRPPKSATKTPTITPKSTPKTIIIKTTLSPSPSAIPGIKPVETPSPTVKTEGVKRSVAKKHTGKRNISQISRSSPVAEMTVKKFKASSNNQESKPLEYGNMRLCGLDCLGRGGMPPSLHCDVCMCLFHPQCVGLGSSHVKSFTCYGCKQISGTTERSKVVIYPSSSPTPSISQGKTVIKLMSSSSGQPAVRATLPTLIRAPESVSVSMTPSAPPTLVSSALPQPGASLPLGFMPQPPHITAASIGGIQLQNTMPSTVTLPTVQPQPPMPTITGVRSLAVVPPPPPTLPPPPPPPPAQPVRLSFPNMDPKTVTGQLLTLPSSLTRRVDLSKALTIRVGDQRLTVPSNFFISGAEGVKVLLPPGALPPQLVQPGSSKPLSLTFQGDSDSQTVNVAALDSGQPVSNGRVSSVTTKTTTTVDSTKKTSTRKQSPKLCHFHKLHAGFDCMLCIFRFLDITDLLVAAQVCRTWKQVATQPCLWHTVNLRWSCVADWEGAARQFQRCQTHTLDLRGMVYFEDKNRTWHQFSSVLDDLVCLRKLMFGQCLGSILHQVAEKLVNLEVLYAECVTETMQEPQMWTSNTKLDLGKFQRLGKLRELKIRAVCGLVLPAFSFSAGLSGLGQLTQLKTLSLTTLRELPGMEFNFLGSLENLEVLEMGDCSSWTSETFECLAKLKKLMSLRLEKGGEPTEPGLSTALTNLKNLTRLELIKYVISEGLSEALRQLSNIQVLSIWPETEKQAAVMNRNTLNAVTHMTFLKELDWGIFNDKPTIENGVDDETSAARAEIERQRLQSIPIQAEKKPENEEADSEEGPSVEFVDINHLIERLGASLPDTKIRVFRVPVLQGQGAQNIS